MLKNGSARPAFAGSATTPNRCLAASNATSWNPRGSLAESVSSLVSVTVACPAATVLPV